jgi:hypothetical protein
MNELPFSVFGQAAKFRIFFRVVKMTDQHESVTCGAIGRYKLMQQVVAQARRDSQIGAGPGFLSLSKRRLSFWLKVDKSFIFIISF